MTLAHVPRYSAEGECRTAVSQDYGRVTKSYHTCDCWSPMPLLRAHGARHARTPGPAAAMEGLLAATPAEKRPSPSPAPSQAPSQAPTPAVAPKDPAPIPAQPVQPAYAQTHAAHQPHAVPGRSAPTPEPCASAPLELDRIPPVAGVLLSYWRRVAGDRPAPMATEINTAHLRDSLSRLCLLAPVGDGGDFVYRACGRAVRRRLDLRPAGRRLTECHDADSAARLAADLRACLNAVRPMAALVRSDPLLPGQKYVELLLPLTDAAGRPAMVLAWRNVPGG